MPSLTHKFRIKNGDMEFEVEGSVIFVEKKLKDFGMLLGFGASSKAPDKRTGVKRGRKAAQKIQATSAEPKAKRRRRRAKRSPKELPAYSAAAAASLKAFIKKQKPKTILQTIVAVGKHHLEFFKKETFTNQDILAGGRAIRKNFKHLPITLMMLRKKNHIEKVAKATWKLGKKVPF